MGHWQSRSVFRDVSLLVIAAAGLVLLLGDLFSFRLSQDASLALRLGAGILVAAIAAHRALSVSDLLRFTEAKCASAWRLIGIGAVISLAGWGVHAAIHFGFQHPVEPAWMLGFEVASALLAAAGFAMLVASWPVTKRARLILDSTIATSSIVVLSWFFVIAPIWRETTGGTVRRLFAALEPATATMLVFSAMVVLICAAGLRKLTPAIALLTSAGIAMGIGALATQLARTFAVVHDLHLADLLIPAGWMLVATAGTLNLNFRSWADHRLKLAPTVQVDTPVTAAGPYAIALMAFGLVAAQELHEKGSVSAPVFILCGVLMTLVIVRQLLTLHENQTLVRQIGEFNRNLENMVDRRTTQLQSLHAFSKAISTSLDFESVIRAAVAQISDAMQAEAIVVNLTPLSLMTHATFGPHVRSQSVEAYPWVLDHLDILDVTSPARFGSLHDPDFKHHLKFAFAPVTSKGRVFGWVAVLRPDASYDHEDRSVLEGLTLELGAALENTRLYELARQMADLDSVTGLPNHRAAQQRFEFLFNAAQANDETLGAMMIDVNNFKHFNDTYGHVVGDQVLKTIARVLRDVVAPNEVPARYGGDEFMVLVPRATEQRLEDLTATIDGRLMEEGFRDHRSGRTIPLSVSIGVARYPFDASTRLELVAAADRNMYHAKNSAKSGAPAPRSRGLRHESLVEGFDLLDSMITAIDNKDYYTRAHSEEVTEYALWIAEELGFGEEPQRLVRLAGLLHDVGKIGIPDEILRKPGQLSEAEFEVMRQHPEVGAFMIGNIPGLADIVPGVRHHHERYDGRGYPDKLAGESIPFLGRLLAVPDVFSALTTERPYRKGLPWEVALERIKADSGMAFDPRIVEAFEQALRKRMASRSLAA